MGHETSGRHGFEFKQAETPGPVATFMAHFTSGREGFNTSFQQRNEPTFAMAHYTSGREGLQSSKPLLFHTGIVCDACGLNPLTGIRFKCSTCPDFDMCASCVEQNDTTNAHPHVFLRISKCIDSNSTATPPLLRNRSTWSHDASCSVCGGGIVGYRYFCSCCAVDLCERCEQQGIHDASHSLLKMPPVKSNATQSVFRHIA